MKAWAVGLQPRDDKGPQFSVTHIPPKLFSRPSGWPWLPSGPLDVNAHVGSQAGIITCDGCSGAGGRCENKRALSSFQGGPRTMLGKSVCWGRLTLLRVLFPQWDVDDVFRSLLRVIRINRRVFCWWAWAGQPACAFIPDGLNIPHPKGQFSQGQTAQEETAWPVLWERAEPWKTCVGNGDPSTLAVCGCCCVRLWLFSLSHQVSHSWAESGTGWEARSGSSQQGWVSMLLAGRDLLRASFKHRVTAEPARSGTRRTWPHFIIPSLRNLVLVVEMITVMGERWRWHVSHLSLGRLSASP